MADRPDGSGQVSPGYQVELNPLFGSPWFDAYESSLSNGANFTHRWTDPYDGYLCLVQSISIYNQAGQLGYCWAKYGTDYWFGASFTGHYYYPAINNRAIRFVKNEYVDVYVENISGSVGTFGVILCGVKYLKQ